MVDGALPSAWADDGRAEAATGEVGDLDTLHLGEEPGRDRGTASGSSGGTNLTVPSFGRSNPPFFQRLPHDRDIPNFLHAPRTDQPCASNSRNCRRFSVIGRRPGPLRTRRDDIREPLSNGPRCDGRWKPPRRYGLAFNRCRQSEDAAGYSVWGDAAARALGMRARCGRVSRLGSAIHGCWHDRRRVCRRRSNLKC